MKLTIKDRAALGAGVQIMPFDITRDGKRYGEMSDFVMQAKEPEPASRAESEQ